MQLYQGNPNTQKELAKLLEEIKAYEKEKIMRIQPGESKADHKARLEALAAEEEKR